MPVYVYRRRDGSTFELHQPIAIDALATCPTTGQSVERVMQPFTPHYRGTGFYCTDHGEAPPSASNAAGDASGRLVAGITKAFVDAYALRAEPVQVVILEVNGENWPKAGILAADSTRT